MGMLFLIILLMVLWLQFLALVWLICCYFLVVVGVIFPSLFLCLFFKLSNHGIRALSLLNKK